jgi:hypothetical protein
MRCTRPAYITSPDGTSCNKVRYCDGERLLNCGVIMFQTTFIFICSKDKCMWEIYYIS